MGSPPEYDGNDDGQSEDAYNDNRHVVCFHVYVIGCLLCTFFGGIIGWAIRDMLIK